VIAVGFEVEVLNELEVIEVGFEVEVAVEVVWVIETR